MSEIQYSNSLQELQKILQCQICTELMSSPFVLHCGHSYCYNCAYQWLRSHRTCPTCRTRIRSKPVLVYGLKEVSDLLYRHRSLLTPESVLEQRPAKEQIYLEHADDPFPGLFRDQSDALHGGRLRDAEDRVLRCVRCHWEIEGSECTHCGFAFSEDEQMADDGSDNLDQETDDHDSDDDEPNEYDLDDSFIVPDDASEALSPTRSLLDSSQPLSMRSDDSRITISSSEDDGTDGEISHTSRAGDRRFMSGHQRASTALIISSDDDEDGSAVEDVSSQSAADEDIEFHGFNDEHTQNQRVREPLRPSRGRRIILDEDSESWD